MRWHVFLEASHRSTMRRRLPTRRLRSKTPMPSEPPSSGAKGSSATAVKNKFDKNDFRTPKKEQKRTKEEPGFPFSPVGESEEGM